MSRTHGTKSCYRDGCRCEECRRANRERSRRQRAAKAEQPCPDDMHGTASGYERYRCHCEPCMAYNRAKPRIEPGKTYTGRNWGKLWTGPEMEVVLRDDLSDKEIARILGRSLTAIRGRRWLVRNDPKWAAVVGMSDRADGAA